MKVLVTGTAGFIGAAVAEALIARGDTVVGVDVMNAYYDVGLKQARLDRLLALPGYSDHRLDIADGDALLRLMRQVAPDRIVHLAAQAGVRYSLENPRAYLDSNLTGFFNVLECCRSLGTGHLVYASSSSVYGANGRMPFAVTDSVDHPVSLYAATKKANETLAHAYAHLYGIPTTGLRFFTVYGPWGRPDMAPFIFARRILRGEPIDVFNEGRHRRDFTYIDDIVAGVVAVLDQPARPDPDWDGAAPDPASSRAPWRVHNIGRGEPVDLMAFIRLMEDAFGRRVEKRLLPMQPGDVEATWADVSALQQAVGYRPAVSITEGVARFAQWYLDFYGEAGHPGA